MSYDDLNRIKQKNVTSIKHNFTYDIQYQGTLSKIEFGNITYSYLYDDRLRPVKEIRTSQKKDWNLSIEKNFDYDSINRIRQITEPNGICGAIFEKGNKVLWLQVLSTDKTENAGGEKVPSGNKSVISVSVTYK